MAVTNKNSNQKLFWQNHFSQWEKTNTSQASYCTKHDLNYHRFGYWRRKILSAEKTDKKQNNSSAFIPVVERQPVTPSNLSLSLPNGIILRGIDGNNVEIVQQLIGDFK